MTSYEKLYIQMEHEALTIAGKQIFKNQHKIIR